MYNHINPKNGQKAPLIADDVFAIIMEVLLLPSCALGRSNYGSCHNLPDVFVCLTVLPSNVRVSCSSCTLLTMALSTAVNPVFC